MSLDFRYGIFQIIVMGCLFFRTWMVFALAFPVSVAAEEDDPFAWLRKQMVRQQIRARGIKDPRVVRSMEKVPRHLFVAKSFQPYAYDDGPLPIGAGQTISQPYIVAFMTEALDLKPTDQVLEIGTGSGYQAAILAELVSEVYSIEIVESLGQKARATLNQLGYRNIHLRIGDGYQGWPEKAPFDAVIVTCAPEQIPPPLAAQLKEGGRMIIPVGPEGSIQQLVRVVKKNGRLQSRTILDVRFVPMIKGRD